MGLASAAERELAGSTPSQISFGLKRAYEDLAKTEASDTEEARKLLTFARAAEVLLSLREVALAPTHSPSGQVRDSGGCQL